MPTGRFNAMCIMHSLAVKFRAMILRVGGSKNLL